MAEPGRMPGRPLRRHLPRRVLRGAPWLLAAGRFRVAGRFRAAGRFRVAGRHLAAGLPLVAALLLGACGGGEPDRWQALDELRATDLGGGRTAPAAGVSTRILNPPRPLAMEDYAAEHGGAAFLTYMNRCGACHAAPDPRLRTAAAWEPLMQRMEAHMASAGLLPPDQEQQDSIRSFLHRHALPRDSAGR